jgi:hypothetical protein
MSNEDKDLPTDIRRSKPMRASKRTKLAALRRKSAANQPMSSLTNDQPSTDISVDNQPMPTDTPFSISSTSNMSALPFLESNIVSTATTDV